MNALRAIRIGLVLLLAGALHPLTPAAAQPRTDRPMSRNEAAAKQKLNAWTIGLAGGLLEGAPIRFATEIARVVDESDALHVLPVVTRGPTQNVEALLYLRGIDAAIINADALEQFRTLVPNIDQRISYILNLFPSELHIFVRPDIKSLADLSGKKVNFNTPGTSAAYSGPLIFDRLKLEVEKIFIPHPAALEQMRRGEGDISAVVFITSKPVDAFLRGRWEPGFKFLPVDIGEADFLNHYLPSTLTSKDYPQLIAEGQDVPTISVPTILAVYNWPPGSDRYARLNRLVDHLFSRIDRFHAPGFHPAWRDVNLAAQVPGLRRFAPAQEWIDRNPATRPQRMPAGASQR
ncbi:C4-dicarboxylate ABC transporter substrate-binding protein [Dankookia rubra]|uniref:C4-dicarboxylate ABC transporter substrate-binding protein n=1 Tax=Dankookia rubra TaxID=1442381 RepID=A0A4R5QCV0_9PROT|nr:TAXI family TRAP transporter solute-binding subunit [Dankookia rubra]TDH60990.1 C4-dicarboxylate ABC transporter substrate-binding protein [Dankookia rubra]